MYIHFSYYAVLFCVWIHASKSITSYVLMLILKNLKITINQTNIILRSIHRELFYRNRCSPKQPCYICFTLEKIFEKKKNVKELKFSKVADQHRVNLLKPEHHTAIFQVRLPLLKNTVGFCLLKINNRKHWNKA